MKTSRAKTRIHTFFGEKREECGIVGIYSKKGLDVAPFLYKALFALQHRGQDAAGFAVLDGKTIEARRGIGLVERIFDKDDLEVKGKIGIGHTRYPTIGECRMCDVQPTVHKNIATAHNGHIANYDVLRKELEQKGYVFDSTVDSEPLAYILAEHMKLRKGNNPEKNKSDQIQYEKIETAVRDIIKKAEGAYSDVAIVEDKLIIFRDPFAIRPLAWGENEDFICFASETVALDINNIPYKGEIRGGELVVIQNGKMNRKTLVEKQPKHCMFEYVYFSRPDSLVNAKSVYSVRTRLGQMLAKEAPANADVVVAVPDTSRTAAAAYAKALNMSFEEGLIKNRYVGRTFIMPSQEKRAEAVRLKLNPIKEVIEGRRIVLFDDSIVRGTTLKQIVKLVREAGAKEIHVRITCPPVKAPCFYGVDMSTYSELIAHKKSVDEIRKYIGADSLSYISLDGLKKAIDLPICTGCLSEEYHTDYVRKLAQKTKEEDDKIVTKLK